MGLSVIYESDCQNMVEIHTVCVPHLRVYTRITRARSLSLCVSLSVSLSVCLSPSLPPPSSLSHSVACLFVETVKKINSRYV